MQDGKIISCGCEDFSKTSEHFTGKISDIKNFTIDKIKNNSVVIVGVEDTQLQMIFNPKTKSQSPQNVDTFKKLCKLLGVIENKLYEENIEFHTVSASAWRSVCKIKGRKREEQKQNAILFVKEKFGIDVSSDTADAIGIAWYIYKKHCN